MPNPWNYTAHLRPPVVQHEERRPQEVVLILAWAELNKKSKPWFGEMAPATHEEATGEDYPRPMRSPRNENDDVIALEMKCTVKELVANKMATMVDEGLGPALCKTLQNAQNGVRPVV